MVSSTATIIRDIHGYNVNTALSYITKREATVNRISVNVFRNVLETKEKIDIINYIDGEKNLVVNEETLVKIKDGVFTITSDSRHRNANKKKIKNQTKVFIEKNSQLKDHELSRQAFEKLTASDKLTSLYGRDSTIAPNGIIYLQNPCSTIHPNDISDIIEGVNTSMWYVGGPGSATALHVEDGDLPSMNLLLEGEDKYWAFIDRNDYPVLQRKLKDHLGCDKDCVIFHKPGFILSPTLLDSWGVNIQFIVQRPGDLVYVGESVLHTVVNNGLNLAEAINYGTKHCVLSPSLTTCQCEDMCRLKREEIKMLDKCTNLKDSIKKTFECSVEDCQAKFVYKQEFLKHLVDKHHSLPIPCREDACDSRFETRQQMKRHYDKSHKPILKERCFIQGCRTFVTSGRIKEHVAQVHSNTLKGTCDHCNREMLKRNLPRHIQKCTGPLACELCGKVFASPQGKCQHKCQQQNL